MAEVNSIPFSPDSSGRVEECHRLDTPSTTGMDQFRWTILKPGLVTMVRIVPVAPGTMNEEGVAPWDEELALKCEIKDILVRGHRQDWELRHPSGRPRLSFVWKPGMAVAPKDTLQINIASPPGSYLVGELYLTWLAD